MIIDPKRRDGVWLAYLWRLLSMGCERLFSVGVPNPAADWRRSWTEFSAHTWFAPSLEKEIMQNCKYPSIWDIHIACLRKILCIKLLIHVLNYTSHIRKNRGNPLKTSDAGSQYRCGRVGKGVQPPSTPQPPHKHTNIRKKYLKRSFPHFPICADGPTDRRTNGRTDQRTDGPTDGPTDGQSLL